MRSPFPYLYRDADVEGMTDGWDDITSYGWEWVSGDTRMRAPVDMQRNMRLSARNSGLFFLQATKESLAMMQRLAHRMATEDVWDQVGLGMDVQPLISRSPLKNFILPPNFHGGPKNAGDENRPVSKPFRSHVTTEHRLMNKGLREPLITQAYGTRA
eukprot:361548-Prorocentrum_minimum.AAC.2